MENERLAELTAQVVSTYVETNTLSAADLPSLIRDVAAAFQSPAQREPEQPRQEPAVPIRSSVKPDYLVCLEDGKRMTMLKRYLMSRYNMTPDEYRAKWGLPKDYPMVAPAYQARRSELAKSIGLGSKGRGGKPEPRQPEPEPQEAPASTKDEIDREFEEAAPKAEAKPARKGAAVKPKAAEAPVEPDAELERTAPEETA